MIERRPLREAPPTVPVAVTETTAPALVAGEITTPDLPTPGEINEDHRNGYRYLGSTLLCWRDCGTKLRRKKESLRHGEWEPWVDENCEFSTKTATNYMRLSLLLEEAPQRFELVKDLGLTTAIAHLEEERGRSIRSLGTNVVALGKELHDHWWEQHRILRHLQEMLGEQLGTWLKEHGFDANSAMALIEGEPPETVYKPNRRGVFLLIRKVHRNLEMDAANADEMRARFYARHRKPNPQRVADLEPPQPNGFDQEEATKTVEAVHIREKMAQQRDKDRLTKNLGGGVKG